MFHLLTINSATKTTDFTDGIHEDVSSDLHREAGPGGVKKPWATNIGQTDLGGTGGTLDQLGGPPKRLGADASSGITGDIKDKVSSMSTNGHGLTDNMSNSTISQKANSGGIYESIRNNLSAMTGGDKKNGSAFDAGASAASKETELSQGVHEDAGKGIESIFGGTARK